MNRTTQKRNKSKKSGKRTRKNRYISDNLFDIFNNGVLFPFIPVSRLVQQGGNIEPKSPLSTDDNIATVEITKNLLENDELYRRLNDKYGDMYFSMSEMSDITYGHPEIFDESIQEGEDGEKDEDDDDEEEGEVGEEEDDDDEEGEDEEDGEDNDEEDGEDDNEEGEDEEDGEDDNEDNENNKVTFKMLYQWDIYQKSATDPISIKTFKLEVNTSKEEEITVREDMTVREFLTKLYFSMEHTPFYVQLNNPQIDSFNIVELNKPNITYETTMGELKDNELNVMIQISNVTL
jgi:hypothetical protein